VTRRTPPPVTMTPAPACAPGSRPPAAPPATWRLHAPRGPDGGSTGMDGTHPSLPDPRAAEHLLHCSSTCSAPPPPPHPTTPARQTERGTRRLCPASHCACNRMRLQAGGVTWSLQQAAVIAGGRDGHTCRPVSAPLAAACIGRQQVSGTDVDHPTAAGMAPAEARRPGCGLGGQCGWPAGVVGRAGRRPGTVEGCGRRGRRLVRGACGGQVAGGAAGGRLPGAHAGPGDHRSAHMPPGCPVWRPATVAWCQSGGGGGRRPRTVTRRAAAQPPPLMPRHGCWISSNSARTDFEAFTQLQALARSKFRSRAPQLAARTLMRWCHSAITACSMS
jgi:hypothetical protein